MIEINEGVSAVSSIVKNTNQVGHSGNSTPLLIPRDNKASPITFPDNVSLPSSNINFAALQTRNDHLNTMASTIRAANKIMDDVAQLLGEKRKEIIQYEKQYPPFQDQSSEKIEFLNSIAALKKQVDALTLIPDNKELASIVSNKDEKQQKEGEYQFPIRPQEVHSGKNGLNIASINTDATDAEIRKFGQELAVADKKLNEKRTGLSSDIRSAFDQIVGEKSIGEKVLESEQQATQKSEKVKYELSLLPEKGLGSVQGLTLLEKLG